jgi:hypothetical protein
MIMTPGRRLDDRVADISAAGRDETSIGGHVVYWAFFGIFRSAAAAELMDVGW